LWDKDLATIGHRRRPEDSSEETGQSEGSPEADCAGAQSREEDGSGLDRTEGRYPCVTEGRSGGREQLRAAELQAGRRRRCADETVE